MPRFRFKIAISGKRTAREVCEQWTDSCGSRGDPAAASGCFLVTYDGEDESYARERLGRMFNDVIGYMPLHSEVQVIVRKD